MKTQFDEMPVYAPTDSGEAMEAIGFRIQAFASGQGDKTAIIDEKGALSWAGLLHEVVLDAPVAVLLDRRDLPSLGAGETPIIAVAPAIANAIHHAVGIRCRSLPLRI